MERVTVRITSWLREEVARRGPGDLMPTIAEVCEQFGVGGVQTVRDSYAPLIEEGLVERLDSPRRWAVRRQGNPTRTVPNVVLASELDGLAAVLTDALARVERLQSSVTT